MSERRPQTAIEGVAVGTALNICSRLVGYLRHVLIAAYIGLTLELDAFYIATSLVAVFIITFGDVFDSAGIPALVKARERDGDEPFLELAASLFTFTLILGAGLSVLMLLCAPVAPLIVPGFPEGSAWFIYLNLFLLIPYSLAYLPYHCLGSFFRSIRGFHVFYVVEFIVQAAAFTVILLYGRSAWAVPVSLSAGYATGFLAILLLGRNHFRFRGDPFAREMRGIRTTIVRMLPVYLVIHGFIIVDRYFASFLEPGAISALFYGYVLATAVPGIMNVENVFITPLAEKSDQGILLTRILSGVWIVSLPVIVFVLFNAEAMVRLFFERGEFTARNSGLTADALLFYVPGLPAFFAWPVIYRTLQICNRFREITGVAAAMLGVNAALNFLFVLRLGMGVKGVALATSLSTVFLACSGLLLLARIGVRVQHREVAGVLPGVVIASVASLLLSAALIPVTGSDRFSVIPRGVLFTLVCGFVIFAFPGAEVRRVRGMVLESFPRIRDRLERSGRNSESK